MTTRERWPSHHLRSMAHDRRYSDETQNYVQLYAQRAALALFSLYLAVFPGSIITVALDQVPAWGEWMGGALLLLQGTIVLCWLIGSYGRRGALAAALVFLLAWGVEHIGVTSGLPFGNYHYTAALQPHLFGVVPLAIPCAWLMVVVGATHLRFEIFDCRLQQDEPIKNLKSKIKNSALAATLVLLLDLQIEPVATAINRYWVWLDGGAYYGVPVVNFAAWWAIGLVMAAAVGLVLGWPDQRPTTNDQRPTYNTHRAHYFTFYVLRFTFYAIPASLYLLNTLMFVAINLARGYVVAGVVGLVILFAWRSARLPSR